MEMSHAAVKDLRSTGYFFDELKTYSASSDMDLATYCTDFVNPYLVKVSESYDKRGHFAKSRILKLAVQCLSDLKDEEIVETIFVVWKIAVSEADKANRAEYTEIGDKQNSFDNRQKLQSAEFLVKLLVNIIRMFKLAIPNARLKKSDKGESVLLESIIQKWEALVD